jgi:erythronate-4-phosphate dehydrogenase
MKILADENITNVAGAFAPYGEVVTVPGRAISNAMLQDADALLVRSITPVNAALLQDTPCRFVGTATSGVDHIDMAQLQARGIALGWAKGCNSISVVDYVFSALAHLSLQSTGLLANKNWRDCSVGIIGCGQIGSALAQRLLRLGMSFSIHDPFLGAAHPFGNHLAALEEVLRQDIITLHVPLTIDGPWPTHHLLNEATLALIPRASVLLNAARGSVIDNTALLEWLSARPGQTVVLDTWEGEPEVNQQLLQQVRLGTAHIAGYSHEGKLKGTTMLVEQFCRHFGYPQPAPDADSLDIELLTPVDAGGLEQLNKLLLAAYDINRDHQAMQAILASATPSLTFDNLRKHYPIRHEFSHFGVRDGLLQAELKSPLRAMGFQLVD